MILLDRRQECIIRKYERGNCGNKRPWPEALFPISLIVTGRKYVYWNNRFSEGFAHRNTQTLNVPMTNCLFLSPTTSYGVRAYKQLGEEQRKGGFLKFSGSLLALTIGLCVINPETLRTFSSTGCTMAWHNSTTTNYSKK